MQTNPEDGCFAVQVRDLKYPVLLSMVFNLQDLTHLQELLNTVWVLILRLV